MKVVVVRFLEDCANDRKGEVKPIDPARARRLVRTGYVEVVEDETEQATTSADEQAARPRSAAPRPPRAERRG